MIAMKMASKLDNKRTKLIFWYLHKFAVIHHYEISKYYNGTQLEFVMPYFYILNFNLAGT